MRKTTAKHGKKIDSARRLVIEKRMFEIGTGITEISRELGASHVAVVYVIDGMRVMPWLRKKIADRLGMEEEVLFGDTPCRKRRCNNKKVS